MREESRVSDGQENQLCADNEGRKGFDSLRLLPPRSEECSDKTKQFYFCLIAMFCFLLPPGSVHFHVQDGGVARTNGLFQGKRKIGRVFRQTLTLLHRNYALRVFGIFVP